MENILFVASECTPFIKTGGLADVIGSLPQSLQEIGDVEVRVMLPMYDEIDGLWREQMEYVTSFDVKLGWRNQSAAIYTLKHNQIVYYFIANDYYFTRKGVYGYYDDGERFVFFSHAIMEALSHLDYTPEILHAHDWQTGIAVALAKIVNPVPNLKTVYTIHNIKYQGVMPLNTFDDFFSISREHIGGMEWQGMLNCMKAAIFHADRILTVSPTYAKEILDPYYSEGLHDLLQNRVTDLMGIINGIDTKEYNPLTDPYIPVNYRSARIKKMENKIALQEKLGLPKDGLIPMYIIISRLVEQKGIHLIERILADFLQEDAQFIVLGTGEEAFENYFRDIAESLPNKARALITFDEGLARQLYAAADFLIMPSKFEPCGLSQLIALQYKTVPIVRETGGLKDTVIPYNEITGEGNGFSFSNYNAHDLLYVLRYSLAIYNSPTDWQQLIRNVNKSQFSWKDSSLEHMELYQQLLPTPIYG
ncbi:glycogen synthase [Caldibacillus lycopersici]|uniref:Glycogen synthase n=1 Tax=Perspicuibacillus lycopersici TaxID=1325689 RepID=A0AAE3ITU9_9BACI|nr:glycogen synthase [Perspicuibacillus lycopersici]MCU9612015.1 glycogen synthase [Perspicuibacillus lycopersici]